MNELFAGPPDGLHRPALPPHRNRFCVVAGLVAISSLIAATASATTVKCNAGGTISGAIAKLKPATGADSVRLTVGGP